MMIPGLNPEALLKFLLPVLEKEFAPVIAQAQGRLIAYIQGPAPLEFKTRMTALYSFSEADLEAIWHIAGEVALLLLAQADQAVDKLAPGLAPVAGQVEAPVTKTTVTTETIAPTTGA